MKYLNPFRLLCCLGLHSYWEVKQSEYSYEHGKYVSVSWKKECSICGKKVEVV